MLKRRHEHQATTKPVPEGCRSSQQAAAAWAWFEHGGSTCITPYKAEGQLMASKCNANCNFAAPSRFKKELLSRTAIPAAPSDDAIAKDHARRTWHSFHDDDLAKHTSYIRRFSRSCRRADQDEAEDEEGRCQVDPGTANDRYRGAMYQLSTSTSPVVQVDHQPSSLLDKFEVDAVSRQLHDRDSSTLCTPSSTCSGISLQENYEAQKAHHHHPQAHIKPRGYFKSSINAHKPSADHEHHQNINDVVHRLLRLRITTSTARAFCGSIATADSISHRHHHPASQQSKNMRGTASHRKSQHSKMPGRSDLKLIGGAPPSKLHHADLPYSKVLQPLMSHLPDMSALLGHKILQGAPSTDDGVVPQRHFDKHHLHIHHHHHHYHHLKHIHQGSQGELLLDHLITKNIDGTDGTAHGLQYPPKLYSFHKEELMIGHAHHDGSVAAKNRHRLHQ